MSIEAETGDWYSSYYQSNGVDRNDLIGNPEVLLQHQATQGALVTALRRVGGVARDEVRVLDVGCGSGSTLANLANWGFEPRNLHGVDVLPNRVAEGLSRFPNLNLAVGDASRLDYADEVFDLVMESTMFAQITDEGLASSISREMIRVTRRGGLIFVCDWRYSKPRHPEYASVSKSRIGRLFGAGRDVRVVDRIPGALVPPLGRRLSRWLPSAYYPTRRLMPFAVGLHLTVLERT